MRIPPLKLFRSWRALAGAACIALLASAAQARELPGDVALGMSAQQLRQAVPALKPVRHPARLAGGLVGRWSGPAIALAGVTLTPTYFFAEAELRRVEYLAQADAGPQAFDALLQWGRAAWGPEMASQGAEGAYASWSDEEMDAYLQRTDGAQAPVVRLVVKKRAGKDASEL
jgi:hypothetical protein